MRVATDSILESWDYVFEQEAWFVPLLSAIQDVTAVQAAWKPGRERHSIWQIVDHLSLWYEYFATWLSVGRSVSPSKWAEGRDWQEITELTEQAWQASVRRLIETRAVLKTELAKHEDKEFDQMLPGAKGSSPHYTIFFTIQGQPVHDAYHCGQICYIRALQGIPAKASWDE